MIDHFSMVKQNSLPQLSLSGQIENMIPSW